MTNIYEINDLVEFLDAHDITMRQFLYCMLLHHDKRHSRIEGTNNISRPLSKLYQYHTNIETFKKHELEDLISKGFLVKDGEKFKPDMLEVTDKFKKKWYGDKFKFKQLLEVYPKRVPNFDHPSKPPIPLCTFKDYDKLKANYNRFVKTYKMHDRVIDIVQWAKENDKLNVGIEKFVNSRYWEELIELRDEHGTLDNYTVI